MTTDAVLERRRALCQERVTLDGVPARITGTRNGWAVVTATNGVHYEYAWPTVERVVRHHGGRFRS